jgi:hypothetical protein
VIGTKVSNQL